ncbi:ADR040Cp [Eremothecium gossypii ATCC 10895]|uniref:ADR040Cp n=1 Tax=Eremothecium gossypii (strain ATCC 10895 / CBS 109.51 / FGSC 9923 / NRRL Y-1056) TaxID=284811 RepID=Q75A78_EREGS|nr:ADR040Cp [Eremothecium gossypii ATCC 10895]AAS51960.1 ADR040Cp [Eremothecium gossypii ATCC 10895]AEY96260.1 FADR040Cp [Eremothecium gossypii FDAG1]
MEDPPGSVKVVVAQFLQKYGYQKTLGHFLNEAGLSLGALQSGDAAEDLETIIGERTQYLERARNDEPSQLDVGVSSIACEQLPRWNYAVQWAAARELQGANGLVISADLSGAQPVLATSSREVLQYGSTLQLEKRSVSSIGCIRKFGWFAGPRGSRERYALGMDGSLALLGADGVPLRSWRLHGRMITHAAFFVTTERKILCFTYGLDGYIRLHEFDEEMEEPKSMDEYKLVNSCTGFQLAQTDDDEPTLYYTREDHTHLFVLQVHDLKLQEVYRIALNAAQFSTHSFSVRDMIVVNFEHIYAADDRNSHLPWSGPGSVLIAATSHTPYMRLIFVELPNTKELPVSSGVPHTNSATVPNLLDSFTGNSGTTPHQKPAVNSGPKVYYDKVKRNIATPVPQNLYSQPILALCTVSSGLLVGADDGVYAVDLHLGNTWKLALPNGNERVKAMALHDDFLLVSLSNKTVFIWEAQKD